MMCVYFCVPVQHNPVWVCNVAQSLAEQRKIKSERKHIHSIAALIKKGKYLKAIKRSNEKEKQQQQQQQRPN